MIRADHYSSTHVARMILFRYWSMAERNRLVCTYTRSKRLFRPFLEHLFKRVLPLQHSAAKFLSRPTKNNSPAEIVVYSWAKEKELWKRLSETPLCSSFGRGEVRENGRHADREWRKPWRLGAIKLVFQVLFEATNCRRTVGLFSFSVSMFKTTALCTSTDLIDRNLCSN